MTQIQRRFNVFIDGVSTHLIIEGCTPPNIQDVTEEIKAGGLIASVDIPMGFQKLEAGIKVNARDTHLMKQVGLVPGAHKAITMRSVDVSEVDGTQQDEVISITGRLNANNGGWEAQSVPKDEYKIGTIFFYRHVIDGQVIHHIDLKNFVGIVNGVDVWAPLRSGMGL